MKIGRGLIISSVLHLGVLAAVTAHVAARPEQTVEDIPSIAVDLEMEIDSAATAEQQPAEADATPDAAAPEPVEMAESDPQPTEEMKPPEEAKVEEPPPPEKKTVEPPPVKAEEPPPVETAEVEKPVELPVPELPVPLEAAPDLSNTAVEQLMADVSETRVASPPVTLADRDRAAPSQPSPDGLKTALEQKPDPIPVETAERDKPATPDPSPQKLAELLAPPVVKPVKKAETKPPQKRPDVKKQTASTSTRTARKQALKQTAALAAGRGSTGTIRSTDGKASEQTYKSKVLARLRSAKRYPDAARAKELEGTAVLTFTVSASGQLTAARITNGSGFAVLDSAALAMARGAAPFPPFPPGMNRAQMTFRVPVQFNID